MKMTLTFEVKGDGIIVLPCERYERIRLLICGNSKPEDCPKDITTEDLRMFVLSSACLGFLKDKMGAFVMPLNADGTMYTEGN